MRERAHEHAVAMGHHLASAQVLTAVNHPPQTSAVVVHAVRNAQTLGFHDVIGLIAGISLIGFLLAMAIRVPPKGD